MAGSVDEIDDLRAMMAPAPTRQRDDVDELRAMMPATFGQYAAEAGSSLAKGAVGTTGSIIEAAGQAGDLVSDALGISKPLRNALFPGIAAAKGVGGALKKAAVEIPEPDNYAAQESFVAATIPQAIGSTIPFAAAGVAGGALEIPAWFTTASTGFLAGANQQHDDAVAHGVEPGSTKAWTAWILGGGGGTTEALALGPILSKWNVKTGGKLGAYVLAAGEEGGQEVLQQFLSNEIANGLDYDDRKALDGVLENGAAGGVVGLLFQALLGGHGGPHMQQGSTEAQTSSVQPGASQAVQEPSAPSAPKGGVAPAEPKASEDVPPVLQDEPVAPEPQEREHAPAEQPTPPSSLPTGGAPEGVRPMPTRGYKWVGPVFSEKLYQGRGATREQVYGEEAVAADRAHPILGPGSYYAFSESDAKNYGDVSAKDVVLRNPYSVDSDEAWFSLLKKADATILSSSLNPQAFYGAKPGEIKAATERLQGYLKEQGADGVIVKLPKSGDVNSRGQNVKRLRESFGHSQVAVFETAETQRSAAQREAESIVSQAEREDTEELSRPLRAPEDGEPGVTAEELPDEAKLAEPGDPILGGSSESAVAEVLGKSIERQGGYLQPAGLDVIASRGGQPDLYGTKEATVPARRSALGLFASPVSKEEIVGRMAKVLEDFGAHVPIRVGSVTKDSLGVYKTKQAVIRIASAGDITTAAHELGHAIEFAVFGREPQGPWKDPLVSQDLQKELLRLGKLLYGDQQPNGGYKREGFAEYMRLLIASPETVAQEAPKFHQWFNNEFLMQQRELGDSIDSVRDLVTTYRKQGADARTASQVVNTRAARYRAAQVLGVPMGKRLDWIVRAFYEMGDSIFKFADMAQKRSLEQRGRTLSASEDPSVLYTVDRLRAPGVTDTFVSRHTTDITATPNGMSLDAALAPVRGQRNEWTLWMYAKRAIALWEDKNRPGGRDPGISLEDAKAYVEKHTSPEFELAGENYRAWWERVMNYVAQHSPRLAAHVARMRAADPGFYIPLHRVLNEYDAIVRQQPGAKGGSPFKGLKGSGRQVRDPLPETVRLAQAYIAAAHRVRLAESMIEQSKLNDMGHLVEDVTAQIAKSMPVKVSVDQALKALAKQTGVDVDELPFEASQFTEETITLFVPNKHPNYKGPIIPFVQPEGGVRYYHLNPELYDTFSGMDLYRLPKMLRWMGWMKKGVTLGATALSPRWALIFNPVVDFQTLYLNTQSNAGFARMFTSWLAMNLKSAIHNISLGHQPAWMSDPALEFYFNSGVHMAPYLYADSNAAEHAAKRLTQSSVRRIASVSNVVEFTKGMFTFPEVAARAVEVKQLARERGYDLAHLTQDQAYELAQAAKQATIDFTAAGSWSRAINSWAPFFNVVPQSQRAAFRAARRRPGRFILRGLGMLGVPSLLLWWKYKDDERWKELPAREKFGWVTIPHPTKPDEFIRLRVGSESTLMFSGFLVAMADAAYRQDPETMRQFMSVFVDQQTPSPLPVLGNEAAAQLANTDLYSRTPIDTGAMQGLAPTERFNEYTSRAAVKVANVAQAMGLPEWAQSPRRVDHMMNGLFPAIDQLLPTVKEIDREKELADMFVVGSLFKRGGLRGYSPKVFEDLYATLEKANRVAQSSIQVETPEQRQTRLMLDDAAKAVSMLTWMRGRSHAIQVRRDLTEEAASIARDAMNKATDGLYDRGRFKGSAKVSEKLKGLMEKAPSDEYPRRTLKILEGYRR